MADESFPVIFTIGGSSRHDVLTLNSSSTIADISAEVEELLSSSVNCQEPLAKYKKKGNPEKVTEIKVRWSSEDRDSRIFPKATTLTDKNVTAILKLIKQHGGKDVLDIDMHSAPSEEGEAAKGEGSAK